MKRPTPMLALIASVFAATAGAQVTAPARPRPATPATPVTPAIPPSIWTPAIPGNWDIDMGDVQAAVADAQSAMYAARAQMPDPAEMQAQIRAAQADMAANRFDIQAQLEGTRAALEGARGALASVGTGFGFGAGVGSGSYAAGFRNAGPPAPWAQGDPADSLYRVAWNAINQGDYRRAANLFASLSQRYPQSAYAGSAPYWQAFALYRVGGTEDLQAAAKDLAALMAHQSTLPRRQTENMDVQGLYARINGVLASRGDRDAAARLNQEAQQAGHPTCDNEDLSVRVEALNALARTEPASAVPLLKRVLQSTGNCTSDLRRNAVFILGQRGDTSAAMLLANVAKSDPDIRVREAAIQWLPRLPNAPIGTLEALLTTDTSLNIRGATARALMSSDDPRARTALRALLDKSDTDDNLRIAVLNSYTSEHSSPEDAAYLRSLYSRSGSERVKSAVVYAISRIGGTENQQWLLALAKNPNESSANRATALERLGRTTMSVSDLASLYDAADSRTMRYQIINILADRREPAATDKLLDIAKSGTDPQVRTRAIDALTSKNDPRTTKLLLDIIDHASGDERKP